MIPNRRPASATIDPDSREFSFQKKLLFCGVLSTLVLLAGAVAEGLLRLAMPGLKYAYAAPIDPTTEMKIPVGSLTWTQRSPIVISVMRSMLVSGGKFSLILLSHFNTAISSPVTPFLIPPTIVKLISRQI